MGLGRFVLGDTIRVIGQDRIPAWSIPPTFKNVTINTLIGHLDEHDHVLVIGHHVEGETRVLSRLGPVWIVTECFESLTPSVHDEPR